MPRKARRRSDAGPAHPGTPRPPVRGEASPGWVAAGQDRLPEPLLDLVAEHTARDRGVAGHGVSDQAAKRSPVGLAGALLRISTTPVEPLTRIRSPGLSGGVATEGPTTAGMPNSRDKTAGCETVPPASVTSPATLVKRTTHAGFVIWQTRMSPLRTSSNWSTVATTRAMPSTTPGDAATPVI